MKKSFPKTLKHFIRASKSTLLSRSLWKRTLVLWGTLRKSRLLIAILCRQCLLICRHIGTYSRYRMMTSYSSGELPVAKRTYRLTRESKRHLKVTIYSLKSNPRTNLTQRCQSRVKRDRNLSSKNYYSLILAKCFRYSIINHKISISKSINNSLK